MIAVNTCSHESTTKEGFVRLTTWDHVWMRQSSARRDTRPEG